MWISKKRYNEIQKEREDALALCGRTVAQNGRLLEQQEDTLDLCNELNEANKTLNKRHKELLQKFDEVSALADERYNEIIYLRERIAELERGEDDGK